MYSFGVVGNQMYLLCNTLVGVPVVDFVGFGRILRRGETFAAHIRSVGILLNCPGYMELSRAGRSLSHNSDSQDEFENKSGESRSVKFAIFQMLLDLFNPPVWKFSATFSASINPILEGQ
jgi:hypothetical protein